jgi:hypothetical protein
MEWNKWAFNASAFASIYYKACKENPTIGTIIIVLLILLLLGALPNGATDLQVVWV